MNISMLGFLMLLADPGDEQEETAGTWADPGVEPDWEEIEEVEDLLDELGI